MYKGQVSLHRGPMTGYSMCTYGDMFAEKKDYTVRRDFNEKSNSIPSCPAIFAANVKIPPLHVGLCLICCICPAYRIVPDLLHFPCTQICLICCSSPVYQNMPDLLHFSCVQSCA